MQGTQKDFDAAIENVAELEKSLAAETAALAALQKKYRDEGLVRQGRALREQIDDPYNPALVGSLNDAGLVYLAEGKLDQAEEMFRRALVILDQSTGRGNAAAGTVLQHLADTAWRRNNLLGAESLYRESVNSFALSVGTSHSRYATALNGLASVLSAQNKLDEAETFYRQALLIYGKNSRTPAMDVAIPSHNLGLMLMNQGRLDEAGPLLERAAKVVEREGASAGARGLIIMRSMIRYSQARGDVEAAAQYETKANELAVDAMLP